MDQGQDGAFIRSDLGRETDVCSFLVSHLEVVFPGGVDDTADTECGLNDVGDIFLFHDVLLNILEGDHVWGQGEFSATNVDNIILFLLKSFFDWDLVFVFHGLEEIDHGLVVLLEGLTHQRLVQGGLDELNELGLLQSSGGNELFLGVFGVLGKIVGRSVSNTDDLDPTI